MKIIQPPTADFASYIARPETLFVEREGEPLAELYSAGYLPYSSANGLRNIFYSARSARVALPSFELTSENRRIAKKFDGAFTKEQVREFVPDDHFYAFCTDYFSKKHDLNAMPRERLETILTSGLPLSTAIYRDGSKPVAYVLEVKDSAMAHYWFSFYDLALSRQSLGLWLMLDGIRDAAAEGTANYYLGTVYGPKALYKTNFAPLEWWDGHAWSNDIPKLKDLSRSEG